MLETKEINIELMTLVSSMVYKICYLAFSRELGGMESKRIFKFPSYKLIP